MSTTWYAKIDCNFHSNRKAMKAGRLGREVYVFILCVNAQKGAIGMLSADDIEPWYVAQQLQMTQEEARHGIDLCVQSRLIEIADGLVSICGWNDDYGKYPLTKSEKQKAYRDRLKERKSTNQNVTGVTGQSNALPTGSNALPPVPQEGRKEGREGEGRAPFDPTIPGALGKLADEIWKRMSDIRLALAKEFGFDGVLGFTAITPASANQKGYMNLVTRLREEGPNAPAIADRVIEVLTSQAREKRSIEWISEKAFSDGAWRTARESIPKWRGGTTALRAPHVADDDPPPFLFPVEAE